jgi:hydroxyacylglutathione hydrolase
MDSRIHEISPGFFFIQRGWLNANHFVQTGPRNILLDSGYYDHWTETKELIEQTGARIADTELLLTTHSHCDHTGGNARIAAASGCRVAMHWIDRYFINQKNGWATWYHYYQQEHEFFPVHRGLSDGEVLALGGLEWQVIHSPGHGMGQICLYAPDNGWLISADAAWDGDFGALTTRIEGLDSPLRQAQTLDRLARLPVSTMYPGHGSIISDGKAAIEKCRTRIARFIEDPPSMGRDQLRKIMLYALMMRGPLAREKFERLLMNTLWFPEVSALYFNYGPERVMAETLDYLLERGLIIEQEPLLSCTLPV